jgi:hypothetical protein
MGASLRYFGGEGGLTNLGPFFFRTGGGGGLTREKETRVPDLGRRGKRGGGLRPSRAHSVTAPILRVPEEGTLGAEKHLEAHLDKLLEEGGVKVTPLVGFRLLSHPHSHLGV